MSSNRRVQNWLQDQYHVPQASPSIAPSAPYSSSSRSSSSDSSSSRSTVRHRHPSRHSRRSSGRRDELAEYRRGRSRYESRGRDHGRSSSTHTKQTRPHPLVRLKSRSLHDIPSHYAAQYPPGQPQLSSPSAYTSPTQSMGSSTSYPYTLNTAPTQYMVMSPYSAGAPMYTTVPPVMPPQQYYYPSVQPYQPYALPVSYTPPTESRSPSRRRSISALRQPGTAYMVPQEQHHTLRKHRSSEFKEEKTPFYKRILGFSSSGSAHSKHKNHNSNRSQQPYYTY